MSRAFARCSLTLVLAVALAQLVAACGGASDPGAPADGGAQLADGGVNLARGERRGFAAVEACLDRLGQRLEQPDVLARRVVDGSADSLDDAEPVSYTHLTLPTNREV